MVHVRASHDRAAPFSWDRAQQGVELYSCGKDRLTTKVLEAVDNEQPTRMCYTRPDDDARIDLR